MIKRYLMNVFVTTEGDGEGEGSALTGDNDGATDQPWLAGFDLDDEGKAAFKDLTPEDALALLTGPAIPEAYAMPEGVTDDQLDKTVFDSFAAIARDANLTQEQMNSIIKFDVERSSQFAENAAELGKQYYADQLTEMKTAMGATESQSLITNGQKAIQSFAESAGSEVVAFLDQTGLGNAPQLIKLFAEVGKKLGEDSFHTKSDGGEVAGDPEAAAKKFYPTMK